MTNEYGEYLNHKIKYANTQQQRQYYENLVNFPEASLNNEYQYATPSTNKAYIPQDTTKSYSYLNVEPTTVDSDPDLQKALKGEGTGEQGARDLDLNATSWGGMESGAIKYDSTQSPNWWSTIPDAFKNKAINWSQNQGILEIIPKQQRQKFTYSTVAYIANHTSEPKTQRIPISDVSVTPHQINFDFYDTTEGRVGVSHAVEKHMSVEFDVYLTDYIFYNWNSGGDNNNKYYMDIPSKIKKTFWSAIDDKYYINENFFMDIEQTKEFTDFRSSFLQQHLGWMCQFNTHAFPTFVGVINDISFNINSGESFAKWHVKLEEAIFTSDYEETGKKASDTTETSTDGSQTNSGGAESTEDIQTNSNETENTQ